MSFLGPGRNNLGGMIGAAIGAMGGLFALGIAPAIALREPRLLINTPILNGLCWAASLPIGWVLGSLLGSFLGRKFRSEKAEMTGGVVGGILTVVLGTVVGWWLWQFAPE
jgi:hypothetical protein